MKLAGLQKLSLLDFPGKLCATVFTWGCSLRCPFCHNASLVTYKAEQELSEDEFFAFLASRKGLLDGVCVSGGEPTLQPDLEQFIGKIKALGFAVKLDTNGTNPALLQKLIDGGLIDYAAMDIKNSREKYPLTTGIESFDTADIEKSIDILMRGKIPYEFRTTLVREFHTAQDITAIAQRINGAPGYYLQTFKDSGDLILQGLSGFTESETHQLAKAALEVNKKVFIRGE